MGFRQVLTVLYQARPLGFPSYSPRCFRASAISQQVYAYASPVRDILRCGFPSGSVKVGASHDQAIALHLPNSHGGKSRINCLRLRNRRRPKESKANSKSQRLFVSPHRHLWSNDCRIIRTLIFSSLSLHHVFSRYAPQLPTLGPKQPTCYLHSVLPLMSRINLHMRTTSELLVHENTLTGPEPTLESRLDALELLGKR